PRPCVFTDPAPTDTPSLSLHDALPISCALQIENQVSDEKQCGHQDGKVTVPHEDFLAKVRACRYAFLELGVEDGIIVTRTDSLGAGLTKQIAFSKEPGDLGDQYNGFLACDEIT